MTVQIRTAVEGDSTAIAQLLFAAFGEQEGPEIVDLVTNLTADPTARPAYSLVAVDADDVVGHILFTAAEVLDDETSTDAPSPKAAILAPLAVIPGHQRQGIGGALIAAGLEREASTGTGLVFVLGHPSYYLRYGFTPAGALGFEAPYPIDAQNANAWMVQALRPGLIETCSGRVSCADALDDPMYWQE